MKTLITSDEGCNHIADIIIIIDAKKDVAEKYAASLNIDLFETCPDCLCNVYNIQEITDKDAKSILDRRLNLEYSQD